MTTETEIKEFAEYAQRVGPTFVPDALKEDAPVPRTWPYGPEAWETFAEAARQYLALQRKFEFVEAIACRGYFPDELGSGNLHDGAQLNAATGQVLRRYAEQDDATITRAREALHGLARAGISIDPMMEVRLRAAAAGGHAGSPKTLGHIIDLAEGAVRNERARRAEAVRVEKAKPLLTVRFRFTGPTGKVYTQGQHRIPDEEAEGLLEWQKRMEADRDIHEWDAPQGFNETNWPPFTLEGVPEPVVAEEAGGQFV